MENLLLVGLSQQMAMRRHMDIIANNIANMNTAAYKSQSVLFEEYLMRMPAADAASRKMSFVEDVATIRNLQEGRFETTGNPLDIAIEGKGYFTVETPDGPRYTRDGHFSVDANGKIINNDGFALLSADGGTFTMDSTERDISIAKDGPLSTNRGLKGKIGLVTFANEGDMNNIGSSLYETKQKPEPTTKSELIQGAIEQSNVQPVVEMTKMMELVQAYKSINDLMDRADDLQRRTIQQAAGGQA